MREWTTVDKSDWGPGPWQDEPDKIHWIDPDTDLDCLIHRSVGCTGSLCGYVAIPPGHPWYGKEHDDLEPYPEVHGGLTYSDFCQQTDDEAVGVCHVPSAGRPEKVWWIGFDCGHAWDYSPSLFSREMTRAVPAMRRLRSCFPEETYKDVAFVRSEVRELARQVADAR